MAPQTAVHLFFVPDDYATGRESEVARATFPWAHVYPPRAYLRLALRGRGSSRSGFPLRVDAVQYLGGDLMHAVRVQRRLGGATFSYKFARARYRDVFRTVFAVDERNRDQLLTWGIPSERIVIVGNLAVDGALAEARGAFVPAPATPEGGGLGTGDGAEPIIVMPGSRRNEIEQLVPFFTACALRLRALSSRPIVFAISSFTELVALRAALARGGDPRWYGWRGRVVEDTRQPRAGAAIVPEGREGERFPIVRDGMRVATRARLAITIPGTKCVELAALGVPTLVCVPTNVPEQATINGPLTYLDRVPFVGAPLKRAAVMAFARRFTWYAQPNIDASEPLMPELHGTLTPGRVADAAAAYAEDDAWRRESGARLRALYAAHVGASERMGRELLARTT